MQNTCSLHYDDAFDYMIQRPNDGKPFVLGGCDLAAGKGMYVGVGHCDDAAVVPEIEQRLLSYLPEVMGGWDEKEEEGGDEVARQTTAEGSGSDKVWTGIMGLTPDEMPYVGEVPGQPGQYIAAGFCGHGE
jgi:glycine/D-amino acid oxidase-like deaminating enzyme